MQQTILAGKPVADSVRALLEEKVKKAGRNICLAIVLAGDDPASHVYKDRLVKLAAGMGIKTEEVFVPGDAAAKDMLAAVEKLNNDSAIDGILPMMPLPKQMDSDEIARVIAPEKDVDCLNPLNSGLLYAGKNPWAPCTPRAVMATLGYYGIELPGKHAVIIGRSNVVGKPLAALLLAKDATVTVCHSKTKNLPGIARQADILVAAVGRAGFVVPDMIKEGAVIIDVGINPAEGGIVGDVAQGAYDKAAAYTPVPGGIGTVSSMMVMQTLLRNVKI